MRKDSDSQYEAQEQPTTKAQPVQRVKKIKKQRKKKASHAPNPQQREIPPLVEQFVEQQPQWFQKVPEVQQIIVPLLAPAEGSSQPQVVMGNTPVSKCQRELERYLRYIETKGEMEQHAVGVRTANHYLKVAYWTKGVSFAGFADYWQRQMFRREKSQRRAMETSTHLRLNNPEAHLSGIIQEVDGQIYHEIQSLRQRLDPLVNLHSISLNHRYQQILGKLAQEAILRQLEESFDEKPIDCLNYHKNMDLRQKGEEMRKEQLIMTVDKLRQYVNNKKPKSHKSNIYLLKTPCSACLSDVNESSNPIENCPECRIRVHKQCQAVQPRCDRCRFNRISKLEKSEVGCCYICRRGREKGLLVHSVTKSAPHRFAHSYCLLLHGLAHVQDGQLRGRYVEEQSGQECRFCHLRGGLTMQCTCCHSHFHGMCAYLAGCSFIIDHTSHRRQVMAKCCGAEENRERLSVERRLKLNLQKVLFRGDKEIFEYLQRRYPQR